MALLAQLVDDVVANRFEVKGKKLSLGRHHKNDIQIDEQAISSRHALIYAEANAHFPEYSEFYLEDLGSTNGTFINDEKIHGKTRLHHNDVIRLAWNKFKFIDDLEGKLERTVHMLKDTKS
jgi:pSer/pThr/pTyr-binding forkhead associated (FHA) protein